jgi:hypothetical protein
MILLSSPLVNVAKKGHTGRPLPSLETPSSPASIFDALFLRAWPKRLQFLKIL